MGNPKLPDNSIYRNKVPSCSETHTHTHKCYVRAPTHKRYGCDIINIDSFIYNPPNNKLNKLIQISWNVLNILNSGYLHPK